MLRLCDLSRIEFMANVPAEQSNRLRDGQAVKILVGPSSLLVQARVTFISPVVDPASGLRELKADLINPPPAVRPGVSAALQLQ